MEESGITKKVVFENYDLDECVNKIICYIKENTIINFKDQLRKETVNYREDEDER